MSSIAKERQHRVRKNARHIAVTHEGEPYIAPAAAAEILYSRADLPILDVDRRVRLGVREGRVRALRYLPRLWLYHRGDVLAEAERLAEAFPLDDEG